MDDTLKLFLENLQAMEKWYESERHKSGAHHHPHDLYTVALVAHKGVMFALELAMKGKKWNAADYHKG